VRTRRQRNADVKLIVAATVAVLLAGFVIVVGLLVATGRGDRVSCGRLPVGAADAIREELEGGPFFQTGGADCSFWLSLEEGDIVAYKIDQRDSCSLNVDREVFVCDDLPVDVETLAQYPVTIETVDDLDTVVVDLTEQPNPSTATSTSTTTTASTTTSTTSPPPTT
jgi:hypothetical protein